MLDFWGCRPQWLNAICIHGLLFADQYDNIFPVTYCDPQVYPMCISWDWRFLVATQCPTWSNKNLIGFDAHVVCKKEVKYDYQYKCDENSGFYDVFFECFFIAACISSLHQCPKDMLIHFFIGLQVWSSTTRYTGDTCPGRMKPMGHPWTCFTRVMSHGTHRGIKEYKADFEGFPL